MHEQVAAEAEVAQVQGVQQPSACSRKTEALLWTRALLQSALQQTVLRAGPKQCVV